MLEIKINKEIRDYTEAVFFGMSMRQCVCGGLGIIAAIAAFFGLKNKIGLEATSWVCVLTAAPFAFLGFFKYHGMTAEQFLAAWIRFASTPQKLLYRAVNLYSGAIRSAGRPRGKDKARKQRNSGKSKKKKGNKTLK